MACPGTGAPPAPVSSGCRRSCGHFFHRRGPIPDQSGNKIVLSQTSNAQDLDQLNKIDPGKTDTRIKMLHGNTRARNINVNVSIHGTREHEVSK